MIVDIEKVAALRSARVVEQNINAAELFDHGIEEALDVGGLEHVGGYRQHFATEAADFRRGFVEVFLTACANRHFGAFTRELYCGGAANAVAAAGDNSDLAFQS